MNDEGSIMRDGIPAIIEAARRGSGEAKVIDIAEALTIDDLNVDSIPMIVKPRDEGGIDVMSVLDEVQRWRGAFAPCPVRREGTLAMHDLESFVGAVNRDSDPGSSVVFADVPSRKLTAVLDFHNEGGTAGKGPRFGRNRIGYDFTFAPQFIAWVKAGQAPMDQKTFSKFIDDRIGDVSSEKPEATSLAAKFAAQRGIAFATVLDLLVFTRTIAAKSTTESEELYDPNTGDVSIQFKKKSDVKQSDGTAIPVPQAFMLSIPVLNGRKATVFNIAVRLRFDVDGREIAWRVEINAPEAYILGAVTEAVEVVRQPKGGTTEPKPETTSKAIDTSATVGGCGLPVFMGVAPPL